MKLIKNGRVDFSTINKGIITIVQYKFLIIEQLQHKYFLNNIEVQYDSRQHKFV